MRVLCLFVLSETDEINESVVYVCTVTDINECSESASTCSHTCTNTVGGFTCSCPTGMMLDNDNKTCVSKYGWGMMTRPV